MLQIAEALAGVPEAMVCIFGQGGRLRTRGTEGTDSLVLRKEAAGVPDFWVLGKVEPT